MRKSWFVFTMDGERYLISRFTVDEAIQLFKDAMYSYGPYTTNDLAREKYLEVTS